MKYPKPNIRINVDLTNPGQFFACCGLLELADRLWPGAEGWFCLSNNQFNLHMQDEKKTLYDILNECKKLTFNTKEDVKDDEDNKNSLVNPIILKWNNGLDAILLDWWNDISIKPWAGSMKHRLILRAMLDAIDPTYEDIFNDLRTVYDTPLISSTKKNSKTLKKREPFYFDPRRGNKSHPLDSGFSPDTHSMKSECCPTVEALCFIGLQRARPSPTKFPSTSLYTVWTIPIKPCVMSPIISGILDLPNSITFRFKNYFRTDQKKHKSFSQAVFERSFNYGI